MDLQESRRATFIAGIVLLTLSLLTCCLYRISEDPAIARVIPGGDREIFIFAAIFHLISGIGILLRSRLMAVLAALNLLATFAVMLVTPPGSPWVWIIRIPIMVFLLMVVYHGLRGTFAYHRIRSEEDLDYRVKRRWYFIWPGAIFLSFAATGLIFLPEEEPVLWDDEYEAVGSHGELGLIYEVAEVDIGNGVLIPSLELNEDNLQWIINSGMLWANEVLFYVYLITTTDEGVAGHLLTGHRIIWFRFDGSDLRSGWLYVEDFLSPEGPAAHNGTHYHVELEALWIEFYQIGLGTDAEAAEGYLRKLRNILAYWDRYYSEGGAP